jgi:hypothetical protein
LQVCYFLKVVVGLALLAGAQMRAAQPFRTVAVCHP